MNQGAIIRAEVNAFVEEAGLISANAIGARVLPPVPMDRPQGQYPKFTIAGTQKFKEAVKPRGPSSEAALITREYELDNYSCKRYALKEMIDAQVDTYLSNFGFDSVVQAAQMVREQHVLGHEQRVAAQVFNPANITAISAATAYTEANLTTVDFIRDFQTAVNRLTNININPATLSLVVPVQVIQLIARSNRMQTYSLGNRPTTLNLIAEQDRTTLAGLLGIREILVAYGAADIAGTGKAESMSRIWNPKYWLLAQLAGGNPRAGGLGRTFYWSQVGPLFTTRSYFIDELDSTAVEVEMQTAEKIVDAKSAILVDTSFA